MSILKRHFKATLIMLAVAGSVPTFYFLTPRGAIAQSPESSHVAIASIVNQHTHSIVLQDRDVTDLVASLPDNGSVTITSSSAFDGGVAGGSEHSHNVVLTKSDLNELLNTGTVTVESQSTNNHTHQFKFIREQECPAIAVPFVAPSGSPSVTPSNVPSVTPSITPSPSPSVTPSGTPRPTPTPTITPTVTPTPTRTAPTPRPTFTILPTPLPTFTASNE